MVLYIILLYLQHLDKNGRLRVAHSTYNIWRSATSTEPDAGTQSYYYSGMLDSSLVMNGSTVIFSMTNPYKKVGEVITKDETPYTETQVNAISRSELEDRERYITEAYSLYNEAPSAKAVILFKAIEDGIPKADNLATVIKYLNVLTEDGMDEKQLSVMVEGVEKKFIFADDVELWISDGTNSPARTPLDTSLIKPGDTFRYGLNSDGQIDRLEMLYTIKDGWKRSNLHNDIIGEEAGVGGNLAYGKIVSNDGTYLRMHIAGKPDTGFMQDYLAIPLSHYTGVTVLTLSGRGCEVTSGKIQDASVGDYVINYRQLMAAGGFVIIKDLR